MLAKALKVCTGLERFLTFKYVLPVISKPMICM